MAGPIGSQSQLGVGLLSKAQRSITDGDLANCWRSHVRTALSSPPFHSQIAPASEREKEERRKKQASKRECARERARERASARENARATAGATPATSPGLTIWWAAALVATREAEQAVSTVTLGPVRPRSSGRRRRRRNNITPLGWGPSWKKTSHIVLEKSTFSDPLLFSDEKTVAVVG